MTPGHSSINLSSKYCIINVEQSALGGAWARKSDQLISRQKQMGTEVQHGHGILQICIVDSNLIPFLISLSLSEI
jgi:hypothetical protein